MATVNREGLRTVDTDLEQVKEQIRAHRKKVFWNVVRVILIVLVLLFAVDLWMSLRTYDTYEVRTSSERTDSEAVKFISFLDDIVKYSNDGIICMDEQNELIWNESFEMTSPEVKVCEGYLTIYDRGGTSIYILSQTGLEQQIETTIPIQTVCVAAQGTIAVLMQEETTAHIKLYDKNGNELANGEFYANQGGIPIDLALSYDAQKLAVDMIDVDNGDVKSTIMFYNFGSVGQNEINNNVGMFTYTNMLIPEIEYLSEHEMIALGDNEIIIFDGTQKPQVNKEIYIQGEIESVFYDEKYVGVVLAGNEEQLHHLDVYDMHGKKVMNCDTAIAYDHVEFLTNHEICFLNDYECEIYTIHSIKKFTYTFDTKLYRIFSKGTWVDYIFVMDGKTEEVRFR